MLTFCCRPEWPIWLKYFGNLSERNWYVSEVQSQAPVLSSCRSLVS